MLYKLETEFQKYETVEDAKKIISELNAQKYIITILDLSMNTYTSEVWKELIEIVKEMKNLKHVVFESIFDSLDYEEMSNCLKLISIGLPRDLIAFEIPSNALSCNFPEEFGIFLSEASLEKINLQDCGFGESGFEKISEYLKKIKNKKNVEYLNFGRNRINKISEETSQIMGLFTELNEFKINGNTIEEESMIKLLNNLASDKLEILNLSDNYVCGSGIEAIGKIFSNNKLKELYLQDIKVYDGDIERLLQIMIEKPTHNFPGALEEQKPELILDLTYNAFEQNCVKYLELLAEKLSFKKLFIYGNYPDDVENLKSVIQSDGGILVEEEDDWDEELIDEDIVKRLEGL